MGVIITIIIVIIIITIIIIIITASQEYEASVKITGPLARQIVKQAHEPPDETEIKTLQASARREKDELLKMQSEQVRESLPGKTERAVELATEKGASNWLTVIPIKEMNVT